MRRAGLDCGICRVEPLSPELRRPCCQSWHVAGWLNGIPRRAVCGIVLTPLPTHFRGSAEEGRLSLGRSPGAALEQTAWQHRLAAAFPRPRCPQRGSPVLQADFTELSVNARAARTKHERSRAPPCATRGSDAVLTEMGQSRASARARPATRSRRDETAQNTQSRSAPHQKIPSGGLDVSQPLLGRFRSAGQRLPPLALNSSS